MIRSLRDKCRTENVGVFRGEIAFSKAGFDMLNNKIQLKPENANRGSVKGKEDSCVKAEDKKCQKKMEQQSMVTKSVLYEKVLMVFFYVTRYGFTNQRHDWNTMRHLGMLLSFEVTDVKGSLTRYQNFFRDTSTPKQEEGGSLRGQKWNF